MPLDPILEPLGAQWPTEESTAAVGELGGDEQLAPMANELMAMPGAMVKATRSSRAEAGVNNAMLEARAKKPTVPEEQMALPKALKGVVGHAVRPQSPLVVSPSAEEEDEVEEIEHEES